MKNPETDPLTVDVPNPLDPKSVAGESLRHAMGCIVWALRLIHSDAEQIEFCRERALHHPYRRAAENFLLAERILGQTLGACD